MQRICATPDCGQVIPAQKGSARPRKYCAECRPPRNRPNPRVVTLPGSPKSPDEVPAALPTLVEAYRQELADAERLETPEGAQVLELAMMFAAGGHTASGAASLSKELRAAKAEALKGAAKQGDALDELEQRRRLKASGA